MPFGRSASGTKRAMTTSARHTSQSPASAIEVWSEPMPDPVRGIVGMTMPLYAF